MNYEELCLKVTQLTKEVATYIKFESQQLKELVTEEKSHNSLVTKVDKTAELMIVETLSRLLPESGFIAEEGTSEKIGSQYNWIIDPLDGTTNFIHGLPCYAISIALTSQGKTVLGVVHEINLDECFYAYESGGAFLNGKKIMVSATTGLDKSLLATGFPYYDYGKLAEYLQLLGHFTKHTRGIRRLGSAATDLAYVACGRFEAFYEYGLSPWDVAAGAFIVSEAGGKVTTFKNGDDYVFGKEILASNNSVHEEMIQHIGEFFNQ
jgi:myo-inositol-1(or 4)-monophosphatase